MQSWQLSMPLMGNNKPQWKMRKNVVEDKKNIVHECGYSPNQQRGATSKQDWRGIGLTPIALSPILV
jgi:hypothetical protein